MTLPARLIDILAAHTATEDMHCESCHGAGETSVHSGETGTDRVLCETCLGSGYNMLGLILKGILQPPADGYGPVELKDALKAYLDRLAETPSDTEMIRRIRLVLSNPTLEKSRRRVV